MYLQRHRSYFWLVDHTWALLLSLSSRQWHPHSGHMLCCGTHCASHALTSVTVKHSKIYTTDSKWPAGIDVHVMHAHMLTRVRLVFWAAEYSKSVILNKCLHPCNMAPNQSASIPSTRRNKRLKVTASIAPAAGHMTCSKLKVESWNLDMQHSKNYFCTCAACLNKQCFWCIPVQTMTACLKVFESFTYFT